MKRFELLVLILSFLFVTGNCQETYCMEVKHKQIKTLQVKVQGETFSAPVIELNSGKVIEINFDALSHGYGRYAYTITHQGTYVRIGITQGFYNLITYKTTLISLITSNRYIQIYKYYIY